MNLGLAIFASVVLVLLVYNKPFRKVFAWIAGISAGVLLIVVLGRYGQYKYEERVQARQIAAHKKLVDACMDRYSTSGYANSDKWSKYIDVKGTCEHNPNDQWAVEDNPKTFKSDTPHLVEIQGGDTLKIMPAPAGYFPLVFLGHGQKFAVECGDGGPPTKKFPTVNKNVISCP